MGHMLKQLEHMLDFGPNLMLSDPVMPDVWENTVVPSVDISEVGGGHQVGTDAKFEISADLPGLSKSEVKIEVVEGTGEFGPVLKISGERTKEDEVGCDQYWCVDGTGQTVLTDCAVLYWTDMAQASVEEAEGEPTWHRVERMHGETSPSLPGGGLEGV
eukprot:608637-Prorocentrum_minimum.AAC.2